MTKLKLCKNILICAFLSLTIFNSNAEVMCLNGQEPTEEAIIEAEKRLQTSNKDLNHLAHKLAKHPESEEHKKQFEQKSDFIVLEANETKSAWNEHTLPKNLEKCVESNLDDESFKLLLKKWDRIIACFPNNNDYIYNHKLLHTINEKVKGN